MEAATSLEVKPVQTFMGWDSEFLPHMAYGRGEGFPAFFLHQSGVHKGLLNFLWVVMNQGVRSKTFLDVIRELHSIDYFGQMID
jgi:hypothetical protein